jgi:hypothetical protein
MSRSRLKLGSWPPCTISTGRERRRFIVATPEIELGPLGGFLDQLDAQRGHARVVVEESHQTVMGLVGVLADAHE